MQSIKYSFFDSSCRTWYCRSKDTIQKSRNKTSPQMEFHAQMGFEIEVRQVSSLVTNLFLYRLPSNSRVFKFSVYTFLHGKSKILFARIFILKNKYQRISTHHLSFNARIRLKTLITNCHILIQIPNYYLISFFKNKDFEDKNILWNHYLVLIWWKMNNQMPANQGAPLAGTGVVSNANRLSVGVGPQMNRIRAFPVS